VYILGSSQHERSLEAVHQLTEELNDLQLSGNLLYRIVEGTKWDVELIGSVDKRESSKNESACSLSSIGGLQNVIEEIHEIIQLALRNTPLVQGVYWFGTETFTQQSPEVWVSFTVWGLC
jgi:ATP-dependent 26S proteasome regulatory subunit